MQENGVNFLIATPEKALCDLINFSKGVNLRFVKDVRTFLEDDIRFDTDTLVDLDIEVIKRCAQHSRRQKSIDSIVCFLFENKYTFCNDFSSSSYNFSNEFLRFERIF